MELNTIIIIVAISAVIFFAGQYIFSIFNRNKILEKDNTDLRLTKNFENLEKTLIANVENLIQKSVTADSKPLLISSKNVFTSAELEVAEILVTGKTSKAIAEIRNTSIYTVNNQIDAMRKKCGAKNRFELVAYIMDNDLV